MKKKKIVTRSIIIIVILLIILIAMGVTDYQRTTYSFEKPLFAQDVNGADDGGLGVYHGIGYSIQIEGNFMPEDEFQGVTHVHFYVFGKEICYITRDYTPYIYRVSPQ